MSEKKLLPNKWGFDVLLISLCTKIDISSFLLRPVQTEPTKLDDLIGLIRCAVFKRTKYRPTCNMEVQNENVALIGFVFFFYEFM